MIRVGARCCGCRSSRCSTSGALPLVNRVEPVLFGPPFQAVRLFRRDAAHAGLPVPGRARGPVVAQRWRRSDVHGGRPRTTGGRRRRRAVDPRRVPALLRGHGAAAAARAARASCGGCRCRRWRGSPWGWSSMWRWSRAGATRSPASTRRRRTCSSSPSSAACVRRTRPRTACHPGTGRRGAMIHGRGADRSTGERSAPQPAITVCGPGYRRSWRRSIAQSTARSATRDHHAPVAAISGAWSRATALWLGRASQPRSPCANRGDQRSWRRAIAHRVRHCRSWRVTGITGRAQAVRRPGRCAQEPKIGGRRSHEDASNCEWCRPATMVVGRGAAGSRCGQAADSAPNW